MVQSHRRAATERETGDHAARVFDVVHVAADHTAAEMRPRCGRDAAEMRPRCGGDAAEMRRRCGGDAVETHPSGARSSTCTGSAGVDGSATWMTRSSAARAAAPNLRRGTCRAGRDTPEMHPRYACQNCGEVPTGRIVCDGADAGEMAPRQRQDHAAEIAPAPRGILRSRRRSGRARTACAGGAGTPRRAAQPPASGR